MADDTTIICFSNTTRADKKLLRRYVDFHWDHYRDDPLYVPLLDYEYLGNRLFGITGFFEARNTFFQHGQMAFFLAERDGETVGRCCAYVNSAFESQWGSKTGFFGHFESVDDVGVVRALLESAQQWLGERGMQTIRGPQNFPVNEATPGMLTQGTEKRPVIYYHHTKPYYPRLVEEVGFHPVKRFLAWEIPLTEETIRSAEQTVGGLADTVLKREKFTVESWSRKANRIRKKEMREIYNEAWSKNFGFVPFSVEELSEIIDDMMLIMDKELFLFAYVDGEPAAFFGAVPNILEKMRPFRHLRRFELLRAAGMLLRARGVHGFRVGYLGVKEKFRNRGLDAALLWYLLKYARQRGYDYCDVGWVLEDNYRVVKMLRLAGEVPEPRVYTMYEKPIQA